jgi:hypothetical protein
MHADKRREANPGRLAIVQAAYRLRGHFLLGVLLASLTAAIGCSATRPIVSAGLGDIPEDAASAEGNGIAMSAAVLGPRQAERLLHVDVAGRHVPR